MQTAWVCTDGRDSPVFLVALYILGTVSVFERPRTETEAPVNNLARSR